MPQIKPNRARASAEVDYFAYPWDWEERAQFLELPFPHSEYRRRLENLKRSMERSNLDCLLVLGDVRERGNVRWLTNFYALLGQTCVVVPREGDPVLVTSAAAHGELMHSFIYETWVKDIRGALFHDLPPDAPTVGSEVAKVIKERKLESARFGIANRFLLNYDFMKLLESEFGKATFENADRMYELTKAQRSPLEVEVVRGAQAIADAGLLAALEACVPGTSELEVCAELEYAMRRTGIETVAYLFDSRVCSGPRSGLKNANPTQRRLRKGDMVFIDISATYKGYALDSATSTVVGGEPSREQESILECGARMTEALVAHSRPGVHAADLVKVAQNVAEEMGEGRYFIDYIAGHGIGASQLEVPHVAPHSEDVLAANYTYSVEPMVVDPERGTGLIEGICLITEDGSEYLSRVPTRPWREL